MNFTGLIVMLVFSRKAAKLFRLLNIKHSFEKIARADTVRISTLRDLSGISIRNAGKSISLQFTLIPFRG